MNECGKYSDHSQTSDLPSTLRDLAVLRASNLDLLSLLPPRSASPPAVASNTDVEALVQKSYEFAKEARSAIKILNGGDVEKEGSKVEGLRSRLEDVLKGLPGERSPSK